MMYTIELLSELTNKQTKKQKKATTYRKIVEGYTHIPRRPLSPHELLSNQSQFHKLLPEPIPWSDELLSEPTTWHFLLPWLSRCPRNTKAIINLREPATQIWTDFFDSIRHKSCLPRFGVTDWLLSTNCRPEAGTHSLRILLRMFPAEEYLVEVWKAPHTFPLYCNIQQEHKF